MWKASPCNDLIMMKMLLLCNHSDDAFCLCFSVLNCVRLLTRILPYIFEDPDWRGFFWSTLPGQAVEDGEVAHPLVVGEAQVGGLIQALLYRVS